MTKQIFPIIDDHGNQINDEVGARVSRIISESRNKTEDARWLFTEFIYDNDYAAWHIENGWFSGYGALIGSDPNDRLHYKNLSFTWYSDFGGSFGGAVPLKGEKMVIVEPWTPDIDRNSRKPFEMHCYKVTNITKYNGDGIYVKNSPHYSIYLEKIETRLAYYHPKTGYQFYISPYQKFKNWVNKIILSK